MPELPEVETIARYLREGKDGLPLIGQIIRAVDVVWERSVATPGAAEFIERVRGQEICEIGRRAKYLVIRLSQDYLLIHLRMSGDLRVEPERREDGVSRPFASHDRVVFHLDRDWRFVFNDPRKFGRVWLLADPQEVLGELGPEPLEDTFTADDLYTRLHSHQRQLKPLLLAQSFLAGLGNIYTDESLHLAGLHPNRLSNRLSRDEVEQLWQAIRTVLQEGIRRNGASIDWVYRGGDFQNSFRVYQRTGQPCPVCGTIIQRRVVGQRSTHFCLTCQPESE
jgi:formamidopyrimidine-DNA glycosylase